MVIQYPFILKSKTPSLDSVYNQETGEWSEAIEGVEFELNCRAEMNNQGNVVASNDGSQLEYAYTVYMPIDVPVFDFGQTVEVSGPDGIIVKASVKKFSRGQLNARLWV